VTSNAWARKHEKIPSLSHENTKAEDYEGREGAKDPVEESDKANCRFFFVLSWDREDSFVLLWPSAWL
jgi:hypothetical protein